MASIRNTGAAGSGSTSASVPVPTGTLIQAGDALYILAEAMATTPNADPLDTPSGWTKLVVCNSGTASTDCTMTVFGKIAGASESAVTVTGTGLDHVVGRMVAVYGHALSAITDTVVGTDNSATTGNGTALGITVEDGSLVLICGTTSRDLAGTTNFSAWVNTNLIGVVGNGRVPLENMDTGIATGTGGGVGMAWGTCLGTSTGNTTFTLATSEAWCAVQLGIPTDPDYAPGDTVVSWTTAVAGHYLMATFKALTAGVPITEVKKAHALTAVNATTLTATWDGGGTATAGNLLVALVTPCQTADISPTWTGSTGNGSGRGAILTKISDGTETGATITVGTTAQYAIALFELDNAQSTTALAFDQQGRSNFTSAVTINFGTPGITQVDEWIGAVVGFSTPPTAGTMVWDTAHAFTEYYEDTDSTAASKIVPAVPAGEQKVASDSGTASDVVTGTVSEVTDAAAGVDTAALTTSLTASDSATASDTAVLAAALPVTDTAVGAELISTFAKATTDIATGADTSQLLAGNLLTANDSATAIDVVTGRALALADSATAADVAAPVDTGLVDGFEDESFQTDAFQTRPSLPGLADITSVLPALTQAATATTNIGVFGSEAGTTTDVVSGRAVTASDSATTSDEVTTVARAVTDTATGADVVIDLDAALSLTDTATVADASALLVVYLVTEAGSAADLAALAVDLAVIDDGEAVDISGKGFTVSDAATGVDLVPALAKVVTDSATAVDTSELITTIIGAIASTLPSLTQAVTVNVFAVPQNLIAVSVSPNEIDLTWDAFIGAVAYDIERDDVLEESPPAILVFDHLTTSYDDVGLSPNTLYAYRVRAVL